MPEYVYITKLLYLHLLSADLCWSQAVGFGQHRNYVDLFMQSPHAVHIQRPKADKEKTDTHRNMSDKTLNEVCHL